MFFLNFNLLKNLFHLTGQKAVLDIVQGSSNNTLSKTIDK